MLPLPRTDRRRWVVRHATLHGPPSVRNAFTKGGPVSWDLHPHEERSCRDISSGSSGALGDPTAPRLGPISRASNGRPSESGRPGPWPGPPCRHCWRTTGTASTQWPTASTRLPANCWSGIATVGGRPGDGHRLFSAGISRSDRGAHAVRSTAGDPDPGLTRDNRECVIATVDLH
jgi:hypothetical protein